MRLPRRTPFADAKREIPQLYSLLYPPQSLSLDEAREARAKGIERVHDVYLVRAGGNTCPVAIECTASLLSALTMDLDASATIRTAAASLAVRQSLSLALIRLVNSLVDSLQSGAFARSIAHIAEQDLKLPLWLVEFRHRATHEGLPGLQNCREAVAAALDWLQYNYWIPTMQLLEPQKESSIETHQHYQHSGDALTSAFAPPVHQPIASSSSQIEPARVQALVALEPILGAYKRIAKAVSRDESLRGRSSGEMQAVFARMEKWVQTWSAALAAQGRNTKRKRLGGAKAVSRSSTPGYDSDSADDSETDEAGEDGNLPFSSRPSPLQMVLLEGLLTPGIGIVPLSRAKRSTSVAGLPDEINKTWAPLLLFLAQIEATDSTSWGAALVGAMTALFQRDAAAIYDLDGPRDWLARDTSYRRTVAAWLLWLLQCKEAGDQADGSHTDAQLLIEPEAQLSELRIAVARSLLLSLGRAQAADEEGPDTATALTIVKRIVAAQASLHGGQSDREVTDLIKLANSISARRRQAKEVSRENAEFLQGFDQLDGAPDEATDAEKAQRDANRAIDQSHSGSRDLLARMEERFASLTKKQETSDTPMSDGPAANEREDITTTTTTTATTNAAQAYAPLPQGWSLAPLADGENEGWKPTPIGCLRGKVPDFSVVSHVPLATS